MGACGLAGEGCFTALAFTSTFGFFCVGFATFAVAADCGFWAVLCLVCAGFAGAGVFSFVCGAGLGFSTVACADGFGFAATAFVGVFVGAGVFWGFLFSTFEVLSFCHFL